MRLRKIIRQLFLRIREFIFLFFSIFTFHIRRKKLNTASVKNVLVIALYRIGDAIASTPTFRAIKESLPQAKVTALVNSYTKDIYERIGYIDHIVTHDLKSSFFKKAILVKKLSSNNFDLAVDLTCDYTFSGAFWSFLSGAKYRIGYNKFGRGFLFNKIVRDNKVPIHGVDELLNIVRSIGLDTKDKQPRISASEEAKKTIEDFLQENGISKEDLLIGIHPGGHYPTQRWPEERFAEVSNKIIEKYKAKIILIGNPSEERIAENIKSKIKNTPLVSLNHPIKDLIALIQRCNLLICNDSGPLHIATAVETSTISTMGPTIPERWWPCGKGHIVIRKNLPCMPCNEGYCRLKTLECMKSITVQEVFDAVKQQLSKHEKQ